MKRLTTLTIIYTLLILGYVCIYVLDVELMIYGEANTKPNSKTNFVYQQF